MKNKTIIILITLLVSMFVVAPAFAQEAENAGLFSGVTDACWEKGLCTACDFLVVFINVANGILAVFAILATVFFLWGAGFIMLSQGDQNRVTKGKTIIKQVITGVIIVLVAWQLMAFIVLIVSNRSEVFSGTVGAESKNPVTNWFNVADKCKGITLAEIDAKKEIEETETPSSSAGTGGNNSTYHSSCRLPGENIYNRSIGREKSVCEEVCTTYDCEFVGVSIDEEKNKMTCVCK